jgi:hypothetical protein
MTLVVWDHLLTLYEEVSPTHRIRALSQLGLIRLTSSGDENFVWVRLALSLFRNGDLLVLNCRFDLVLLCEGGFTIAARRSN